MLGSILLSIGFAFFIAAFCLYHFMVFRVNKHLPADEKFPHSLSLGQPNELGALYKSLYPRSAIYQLTLTCAITMVVLAVAFACFRVWSAAEGKLP
jgi:tellurite resistance protein TehA-like permease